MSVAVRVIWAFCRIVSSAMETVGFAGVIFFAAVGLWRLYMRLIGEETTENE